LDILGLIKKLSWHYYLYPIKLFSYEIFIVLKSRNVSINDATYRNDFVGPTYPADDVKIHGATYGEGILDEVVSQQYTISEGLSSSVTVSSNVVKSRNVSINDATYQNDVVGPPHPADDVKIHGATYDEDILDEIVPQQYTISEELSSSVTVSSNVKVNVAQVITVQVMPSNSEHLCTSGSEVPIGDQSDQKLSWNMKRSVLIVSFT
jgi:hypothetical protein